MSPQIVLRSPVFYILLIVILGYISYANSFGGAFVFDDFPTIVNNPLFHNTHTIIQLFFWQPSRFIAHASFLLNYVISGTNVYLYHIINLSIHVLTSIIVYFLVHELLQFPTISSQLKSSRQYVPLFVSLLFLVHPLQTQAVSYIIQRTTSLCALFYVLSLLCFCRSERFRRWKWLFVSLGFAFLAFFTKENSYTLPFTILLLQACFYRIEWKKLTMFFILALCCFGISILSANQNPTIPTPAYATPYAIGLPRSIYVLTEIRVIVTYLRLFLLPIHQNLDYDYPLYAQKFLMPTLGSALVLLCLVAVATFIRNHNRVFSFGILFFFLTIAVESSFIPLADVIAEHRMYLPILGLSVALLSELFLLISNYSIVVCCLLILCCSLLTRQRNLVWASEYSLWQNAMGQSPHKMRPRVAYAITLDKSGRTNEAIDILKTSLILNHRRDEELPLLQGQMHAWDLVIHYQLATFYIKEQNIEEAIQEYTQIAGINPQDTVPWDTLGVLYGQHNNIVQSKDAFKKSLSINPNDAVAYYNLGMLAVREGNKETAFEYVSKALEIKPDFTEAKQILQKLN